jgi:rhodanese-related sulfurtransferase
VTDLTATQAFEQRDDVQLLDVREPFEWAAGHIDGAVHVPMHSLRDGQDELAADRTIVCVCRSGVRSATVAQALVRAGYDAVNMLGGMHAWAAAGLPFISAGDEPPVVA